jgi:hypothetical protein
MWGPARHVDQTAVSEGLAQVDLYKESLENLLSDIGIHRGRLDAIESALADCLAQREDEIPQMDQRGYWSKRTSARKDLVESISVVNSSLMMARAHFIRVLVDEEGYGVSDVALFLGNARQLTKRLYDAARTDKEIKSASRQTPVASSGMAVRTLTEPDAEEMDGLASSNLG